MLNLQQVTTIEEGADTEIKDSMGQTAAETALEQKNTECADLIIRMARLKSEDRKKHSVTGYEFDI